LTDVEAKANGNAAYYRGAFVGKYEEENIERRLTKACRWRLAPFTIQFCKKKEARTPREQRLPAHKQHDTGSHDHPASSSEHRKHAAEQQQQAGAYMVHSDATGIHASHHWGKDT
jgi:hypothetical protein